MDNLFKYKRFFITGGTGSLGQALIKRLLEYGSDVIVYSRDEGKQYLLPSEIECIIGDVRDYDKLNYSIGHTKPDYVIHAAALKRIDTVENFPSEGIKTNILGSENTARACINNRITKGVLVATDKGSSPCNVYGATKFLAERLFLKLSNSNGSTSLNSVRYGNVLASRGSFIPTWKSYIDKGLPVPITSFDCTRFLFTLDDAVDAVLGTFRHSIQGIYIPKMKSFSMAIMVAAVKKYLDKEFETKIVGLRKGEKIHEDLISEHEAPNTIEFNGYYIILGEKPSKPANVILKSNSPGVLCDDVDVLVELIQKGLK